jgi:Sensors of blue-light using FAD
VPLSRLLYVSRCALASEGAAREAEVREIAEGSAHRNLASELTGSLLHVGDTFIQVLEGPTPEVERVFEVICCDFRHDDVKLIDLAPIKGRVFPEWSMAFLSAEAETRVRLNDDLEEIRFLVGINAREAINQMRHLLDQARG